MCFGEEKSTGSGESLNKQGRDVCLLVIREDKLLKRYLFLEIYFFFRFLSAITVGNTWHWLIPPPSIRSVVLGFSGADAIWNVSVYLKII